MYFTFNQNNSGGNFVYDEHRGISHFVIVEADTKSDAVTRAESIGLYFDGEGDCPCCGDRWYEPYDDGSSEPEIYGKIVDSTYKTTYRWIDGFECFVHYKDGSFKGFDK